MVLLGAPESQAWRGWGDQSPKNPDAVSWAKCIPEVSNLRGMGAFCQLCGPNFQSNSPTSTLPPTLPFSLPISQSDLKIEIWPCHAPSLNPLLLPIALRKKIKLHLWRTSPCLPFNPVSHHVPPQACFPSHSSFLLLSLYALGCFLLPGLCAYLLPFTVAFLHLWV